MFELGENILPSKVMSQDVFNKSVETFVDSMNHLSLKEAMISIYGGETLANKKVIKEGLLKFGSYFRGVKLVWVMNTNGSLLKEEDILFFKEHGLEIHISIDGKEEIHNISRPTHKGKGTFHMVTPALELIRKHKAPSQINTYMMPSNFNHLKDLVEIASKYEIPKIYLDQFYNLDMITHQVGMKKYMQVYLYGMSKGIEISGPWKKVMNNVHNQNSRKKVLEDSLLLDVNIDGTCYFPIHIESKNLHYHIDTLLDKIKNGLREDINHKTLAKSSEKCEGCELKSHCAGIAIEQVQYHIGVDVDTKVSCDFFRDWCKFLMRPVYYKKEDDFHFISMIDLEKLDSLIKDLKKTNAILQKNLWSSNNNIAVNIVEYVEEIQLVSKMENLPSWVSAVVSGQSLYLKGDVLTPAIVHELTHVYLAFEEVNLPPWLEEGVCEWQQRMFNSTKRKINSSHDFKNIQNLSRNDLNKGFSDQRPGQNSYYDQAFLVVEYLISLMGEDLFKEALLLTKNRSISDILTEFTGHSLEEHIEFRFRNKVS